MVGRSYVGSVVMDFLRSYEVGTKVVSVFFEAKRETSSLVYDKLEG